MKKAAPCQQCHGIESHNRNETSATQNKLLQISSHTPARTRQRQLHNHYSIYNCTKTAYTCTVKALVLKCSHCLPLGNVINHKELDLTKLLLAWTAGHLSVTMKACSSIGGKSTAAWTSCESRRWSSVSEQRWAVATPSDASDTWWETQELSPQPLSPWLLLLPLPSGIGQDCAMSPGSPAEVEIIFRLDAFSDAHSMSQCTAYTATVLFVCFRNAGNCGQLYKEILWMRLNMHQFFTLCTTVHNYRHF